MLYVISLLETMVESIYTIQAKKKTLLLEIRTTLAKDISSRINNQLGLMVTGFTLGPQLIPEPQLLLPN